MNKEKTLGFLVTAGKLLGFVTGLGAIPFVPAPTGIMIFAAASTLKEIIKFTGDLVDDGQKNDSFKP